MAVARSLRLLNLLAALDSLATGIGAVLFADKLFAWLQLPPTRDGVLLCLTLGALTLTHAPCLILAALRPRTWGGLVVVPLVGRALLAAAWLWLLNAERVRPSPDALRWLLVHDAVWLPLFVVFLLVAGRTPKAG